VRVHDLIEAARNFPSRVAQRGSEFAALAAGQSPSILFISCSDSRVVPSLITNARPGQLFELRISGPVLPPHTPAPPCGIRATIDYAVSALDVHTIVVCGHSHCGTVQAIEENGSGPGEYGPSIDRWLRLPHVRALRSTDERAFLRDAAERHVVSQLATLGAYPQVAERVQAATLTLHGWYYEVNTGVVRGYNSASHTFDPL
jgi:carbonic anhydrase